MVRFENVGLRYGLGPEVLRFAARNATGQDVYTWTALPRRSILGPNERLEFQSRLAAPPADATDVMVRFFTAQDAASGAK